jgi:hypothetical protein
MYAHSSMRFPADSDVALQYEPAKGLHDLCTFSRVCRSLLVIDHYRPARGLLWQPVV